MYKLRLGGIYIEITSICNRNCPYCYNDSSLEGLFLDKEVIFRVFNECKQSGITSVSLSGGEPFMHPDIDEILAKLEELHMRAVVITNLSLVSIDKAAELAEAYGVSVIPTLLLFKEGRHGEALVAPASLPQIKQWLNRQLPN